MDQRIEMLAIAGEDCPVQPLGFAQIALLMKRERFLKSLRIRNAVTNSRLTHPCLSQSDFNKHSIAPAVISRPPHPCRKALHSRAAPSGLPPPRPLKSQVILDGVCDSR